MLQQRHKTKQETSILTHRTLTRYSRTASGGASSRNLATVCLPARAAFEYPGSSGMMLMDVFQPDGGKADTCFGRADQKGAATQHKSCRRRGTPHDSSSQVCEAQGHHPPDPNSSFNSSTCSLCTAAHTCLDSKGCVRTYHISCSVSSRRKMRPVV